MRIFIPRAPTLGIPETPEHHMLGTDRYVGDSSHLSSNKKAHVSSTGKVHVYITRKSIFHLTRKSIRLLEILHKNVLCLRDHRNVVVKPRWWLAFSYRSTNTSGATGGECVSGMRSRNESGVSSRSGGDVASSRLVSSRGSSPAHNQLSSIASVDRPANLHAVTS